MIETITGSRGRAESGPVPGISSAGNSLDRREICLLLNNVCYFLHDAFIITERIGCRLMVIHAGQIRTNKCYADFRSAKIAFARKYNRKSWLKGVKADWTKLYKPYSGWLDKKIKILKKTTSISHNYKEDKEAVKKS